MIILYLAILALLVYSIFFISQFGNIVFKGYAPFISTDRKTIKKILDKVQIKERPTIYELGCGRARFLKIAEKLFPRAELIGIENLSSLFLINKLLLKLRRSRIKLLKKDILTANLERADLIYCYLNNSTMEKLGIKFKQECRPETQIISRSFPIPQFKSEEIITVKNKKIYFYKI